MQKLVGMIRKQTTFIFHDMWVAMKTCDWDYQICGCPVWRYFYHVLHSCDRWYINPRVYEESEIHVKNLDKVDLPCDVRLTEDELWSYYEQVKNKILTYLDSLHDDALYEQPENCEFTRMELILGQYRHFMCHIGMFHGITIATKGKYPKVAGLNDLHKERLDDTLYDE